MRGINLEGLEAKLEELQGVMKSLEREARDLMQVSLCYQKILMAAFVVYDIIFARK